MKYRIANASLTLGSTTILEDISIDVTDTSHIGIIGKNGAGKTTLLKAIIDPTMFDRASLDEPLIIEKIGDFKIGYQSQITFKDTSVSLIDEVEKTFVNLKNLETKLEKLTDKMNKDHSQKTIDEYTTTLERYERLGGYTYKKEYEIMLKKFGFNEADKTRPIGSFSGGERTKIAFIKLLLSKPDLLLLDEPTNHLDLDAIEWLETYLKNYKKAFIIVSHDRMFLNNTVSTIYDVSHGHTKKYSGNYDFYLKKYQEDYRLALKKYENQQKEIKHLRELYERFRNKPTKAKMALSKLHMIEKMDILERPLEKDERTFRTNLDKMTQSTSRVLLTKNLEFGYDKPLGKINIEVTKGDKIGIIGANGTGKSTLLKTLASLINPLKGSINYGLNLEVGYFDQNMKMENENNTVLEEFTIAHPELLTTEARNALGSFLFRGDDVFKKVSVLSGGERVRLSLCKILYNKPNFLLLDEPTNHMDIVGKTHLEELLKLYKGTLIFVSHDRYFVKNIATKLIVFSNSNVEIFAGTYDEYMAKKNIDESPVVIKEDKPKQIIKKETPKPVNNTYGLKKELNKIESDITRLEKEKSKLNEEMLDPNIFNDYSKSKVIGEKLNKIETQLEELNKKWEEIANIIEI